MTIDGIHIQINSDCNTRMPASEKNRLPIGETCIGLKSKKNLSVEKGQ